MGTNYYLHESPCPLCAHPKEVLHIGKSSGGWCFSLATHPRLGIDDLDDWIPRLTDPDCLILNEYDEAVEPEQMIEIISKRDNYSHDWDSLWWAPRYGGEKEFHDRNYSERGPNGLLRHKLGPYCIRHGAGTWDCMVGEFS